MKSSTSFPVIRADGPSDEEERTKDDARASDKSSCAIVACLKRNCKNDGVYLYKPNSLIEKSIRRRVTSYVPVAAPSPPVLAWPIVLAEIWPHQTLLSSQILTCINLPATTDCALSALTKPFATTANGNMQ
jgi:hypothetical protein